MNTERIVSLLLGQSKATSVLGYGLALGIIGAKFYKTGTISSDDIAIATSIAAIGRATKQDEGEGVK